MPDAAVDPERHAGWLAPVGAGLVVLGVAVPHLWALVFSAVGFVLLLVACYSAADGLLLFGPFVRRELLRAVRQTRVLLWRTVIVVVVGLAVGVAYFLAYYHFVPPNRVRMAGIAAFGFVGWILCLSFLPLLIQSVASTVTEDREAKRLDFLLVTDLRNREVVLGKALGRVLTYAGYLLAPLPFVVLAPPLFGLNPEMFLLPAAYFGLTCLSAVGLGLAASVYSTTSKKAGANATYLAMFYILATLLLTQLQRYPAIWTFPTGSSFQVKDLVEAVSAGNPFPFLQTIPMALATGANPSSILLGPLRGYAAVHVALFFAGVLVAVWKLRPASADMAGAAAAGSTKGDYAPQRPPVWNAAIVWKERYCGEFIPRSRGAYRLAVFMTFLLAVLPALVILWAGFLAPDIYRKEIGNFARITIPFVAWITFAFTGRITSGLIARERERDTLVSLVSTPLTYKEILWQKFLGGLLTLRGGFYWLLILGTAAVVAGFYPVWAFVLLAVMYVVWSIPLATFGLVGSASAPTTQKAQTASGLWFVAWIIVPLLVWIPIVSATGFIHSPLRYFAGGMAAVFGLSMAAFAPDEDPDCAPLWFLGGIIGAVYHLAIARYFYRMALNRFTRSFTGDEPAKPVGGEAPTDKSEAATQSE
jgi:ABC-type transport system involved in multi-copper enzyme maturation permease subunit